jgi:hypothetical protein
MADRVILAFEPTEFFPEQFTASDRAKFPGGWINAGAAGDMGGFKIGNVGDATADGDVIVNQQAGAELGDLTITSGGDIDVAGGGELIGLPATPSGDTAAASKAYVDSVAQGLDTHESVRVATTAPGTLATDFEAGDAIDGITLVAGDRILIKNQASGIENGVYIVEASGAPTRADDWLIGYEAAGAFTFIEEGNTNADSGWVCTNDDATDTTGTHALTFSQFSGAGQITAGAGLTKSGNTIDVIALSTGGLQTAADSVSIKVDTTSTTTTEANAAVTGTNGLSVKVDNDTIEGSLQGSAGAESLRVKAGGIDGTHLDPAIVINTTGNITTTAGIFTGDGSGLTNLPAAASTDAVTVTALKSTAGTITKGQVVHLVGYSAPDYTVELADADTGSLMPAIGIATTTITEAAAGTVVIAGKASGLDTSSFSAGDDLYVSTTAGSLTATKPTGATNLIQRLGEVAFSHATTGVIQVTGAGRSNDLPNIASANTWVGNGSGVPTATPFGDGIVATAGSEVQVDITADIGLHFNTGKLEIELDNTPDTLDADASGLKVVGLPSLFKVNDVAVGAAVTAANLDTLTDGSNADALHVHASAVATEAPKVENTYEVVTATVAAGDPVRFGANDKVQKADADATANARVVGVARVGAAVAGNAEIVSLGPCAGVLAGATFNTPYYLDNGGGISTSVPAGNRRIVRVGFALNATDLFVEIMDFGRRAA